jgi:Zn-finger nucleic acid-binding protein
MNTKKEPILLTHGISEIVTLGQGGRTAANNPYMYLVGDITGTNQQKVKGIYAFALPFKTGLHLLGVPAGESGRSWHKTAGMEQVVLEGEYPTYFSLYAEEGQQALTRYHLDPQAMVFSVDFCKTFHWEIVNNTLYFLDEDLLPSLDTADEFISLITPALSQAATNDNDNDNATLFMTRIGEQMEDSNLNLNCPVCDEELMKGKQWLVCPKGHGYLIKGTEMLDVRRDSRHIVKELAEVLGRPPKVISFAVGSTHDELVCPHCAHPMNQTRYQMTEIVLDVCTYCPYRWIDGDELDVVLGKYRHESYE